MDAPEDKDIKLQKASGDLLSELQHTLPGFLWKSITPQAGAAKSRSHIARSLVGYRTTDNLINLLEPFQEWPQLLDPCLASILTPLISAYLSYLLNHKAKYYGPLPGSLATAIPLPRAISKLLYTLCKIRGEKVISRFFNNEPKFLEPMLDAFRAWNENTNPPGDMSSHRYGPMVWEERYIMLLWLSHLMLAPFDLASISSPELSQGDDNLHKDMKLPVELPAIARRIIPICTTYITVASKEREAARALLVRIAVRPDMRRVGLLDSSVHWALASLESESKEATSKTIYAHVGVLSFLAGILVSAEKSAIAPFLMHIFQSVQKLNAEQTPLSKVIISSALARKVIIKILRAVTVTILEPATDTPSIPEHSIGSVLEDVIDYLLTALADKDTPVRYAASKALSVITLKLDASMAADVVEAVVGSLREDVLWEDTATGLTIDNYHAAERKEASLTRNLTAVSALRWQGLILALSHLLYRRSPPPELLPEILSALVLALDFEQRSAVGSSVGTNVRDAACFGIWALARRYTTKELLHVDTSMIVAANHSSQPGTVLQILSNELVAAATLDSSGNIRRGASAALQELIGRHPDTVIEGISLVQVVDYHAVALRSRAMKEVAVGASKLGESYWNILLDGFLGWKGIGSPDAESRRQAATAIGFLGTTAEDVFEVLDDAKRDSLARTWVSSFNIDSSGPSRGPNKANGYVAALGTVYRFFQSSRSDVSAALTGALISLAAPQMQIESKVAAIKSLSAGVLRLEAETLAASLTDYTADKRGDIGSLVRVEAIDAVGVSWTYGLLNDEEIKRGLIAVVCGLAAEKLDKVRFRAWTCLQKCWPYFGGASSPPCPFSDVAQTSTVEYYQQLLSLRSADWIRLPLLEGYVTSAGVGSESLLRASRAALVDYAEHLHIADLVALCQDLMEILRRHIADDRLIIPALEVVAFLLDAGQFQRINNVELKWRNLLALIQKSHFKSGNVHKLEAAVKVYTGLASVKVVQQDVLAKLCSMLLHPFPQIRNAVADALCVIVENDLLRREDWSKPPKELTKVANDIRAQILVDVQG
ncbi:Tubulin-specific chaperone D, C-terminal [Lasallia pustulata]|uniref:Tubulin-specific chaperone D, C-terminal n=1 Tax=Lasallia pustulata TaxID=136370 RepID=A0A1W5D950_9LECA|nr:Tubulin-specific chaperone D, C-terminal [Lasallia pustulata]